MIISLKMKLLRGAYASGDWEGVLQIDASSTLEQLHFAIQDGLKFDNDHMYEFFTARGERSRERVSFDDENGGAYDRTIASLFPLPKNHHLYYLFDYGDNWLFSLTKSRSAMTAPEPKITYPRLVLEVGKRPEQYPSMEDDED